MGGGLCGTSHFDGREGGVDWVGATSEMSGMPLKIVSRAFPGRKKLFHEMTASSAPSFSPFSASLSVFPRIGIRKRRRLLFGIGCLVERIRAPHKMDNS